MSAILGVQALYRAVLVSAVLGLEHMLHVESEFPETFHAFGVIIRSMH